MYDQREYEEILGLPKGQQAEELGKRMQALCEQHASEGKNTIIIPVHVLDALSHILTVVGSEHQKMKKTLVEVRTVGDEAVAAMQILLDVTKQIVFYLEKHESESSCEKDSCHMGDFSKFFHRKMEEGTKELEAVVTKEAN